MKKRCEISLKFEFWHWHFRKRKRKNCASREWKQKFVFLCKEIRVFEMGSQPRFSNPNREAGVAPIIHQLQRFSTIIQLPNLKHKDSVDWSLWITVFFLILPSSTVVSFLHFQSLLLRSEATCARDFASWSRDYAAANGFQSHSINI